MTGRGGRWTAARVLPAVLAAALLLLVSPAPAGAATGVGTVPSGTVTPSTECVQKNSNGTYTALLGYSSSAATAVTIAKGQLNQLAPTRLDGAQPTTFQPGAHRGAFSVTLTSSEYTNGAYWYVDGGFAYFDLARTRQGPFCPAGTALPATGNGTGVAAALVLAGAIGVLLVRRVRRRGEAATMPLG